MKAKFYFLTLAATLALTATAQRKFTFTRVQQPKATEVRVSKADETTSPYGTVVTRLYEDFSKMTTGSVDGPDMDTNINYDEPEYPWWNLKADYTGEPHWGANNAHPAGGCICLWAEGEYDQASLNTTLVDCEGYDNIATLQFKARTKTGTLKNLYVESAETHNMSPSWDICGSAMMPEVTSDWQTYEVTFYGTGPSTIFNMVLMGQGQIYIDDVKVYQVDQYVHTPVLLPHSNYTGSSFDANWKAVDGADSYLLNVYSKDENGNTVDFLTDKLVKDTRYTVTGIESGKTYYYTVRAVKGTKESIVSPEMEVFDLAAPTLKAPANVTDGKYTASWDAVPTAERYNYWAYFERTAEQDGAFTITDEQFTDVRDANGGLTGWTVENPSSYTYNDYYPNGMTQAGWHAKNGAPYTDYICVDGYQYIYNHSDAGLLSPELDLSKDNGKIDLSVKLYGVLGSYYDENGQLVQAQTKAAVALFNYDEQKGDFTQAELVYPEGVEPAWKTFNVTLTKGTKRSIIGIYAVNSPDNLYIDDLKITQNYKKGETFLDPYLLKHWIDTTAVDVTVPGRASMQPLYHKVSAVKARSNDGYSAQFTESRFSDLQKVSDGLNGIAGVTLQEQAAARAEGRNIVITNPKAEPVSVYTLSGTQLFADHSGRTTMYTPSQRGIYLVKIGTKVVKVRN